MVFDFYIIVQFSALVFTAEITSSIKSPFLELLGNLNIY